MSSSTYIPYIIFSHRYKDRCQAPRGTNLSALIGRKGEEGFQFIKSGMSCVTELAKVHDNLMKSPNNENKFYGVVIEVNGTHSCRETVLSSTGRILEEGFKTGNLIRPVIAINYIREVGSNLSKSRVDSIMKFGEKVFHGSYAPFEVSFNDDKLWISFEHTSTQKMYDLSFLLYCFRILEPINKYLEVLGDGSSTWLGFLRWVSDEFLKNSNWGDSSNINIAMSLYAFAVSIGKLSFSSASTTTTSGPQNLVQKIARPGVMTNWLKTVYLPLFYPENSLILSRNNAAYLSSTFKEDLESLYECVYPIYDAKIKAEKEALEKAEALAKAESESQTKKQPRKKRISQATMKKVLGES